MRLEDLNCSPYVKYPDDAQFAADRPVKKKSHCPGAPVAKIAIPILAISALASIPTVSADPIIATVVVTATAGGPVGIAIAVVAGTVGIGLMGLAILLGSNPKKPQDQDLDEDSGVAAHDRRSDL